jgi:hypothetical protein
MAIKVERQGTGPKPSCRGGLEVELDGITYALEAEDPGNLIHSLNSLLRNHDPDLIITE